MDIGENDSIKTKASYEMLTRHQKMFFRIIRTDLGFSSEEHTRLVGLEELADIIAIIVEPADI